MKKVGFFAIALTILFLFTSIAAAIERNVPSEYSTIQAAINACSNSDVVIVAPGTYTDDGNRDIDFLGKAITVRSTAPDDPCVVAATIIDCNSSQANPHRGFYLHTGEGTNSVLDGLTIKRGYVYDSNGGGIFCIGASPIIRNCVITNNSAYGRDGNGILVDGGHAYGGGAFCSLGSNTSFFDCIIINNSVSGGYAFDYEYGVGTSGNGYGGGISCDSSSNVSINNCILSTNQSLGNAGTSRIPGANGYGGAISCTNYSNVIIRNSQITNNNAYGGRGMDGSMATIPSGGGQAFGGGIFFDANSQPIIADCNISGNSASGGNGGDARYSPAGTGGNAYGGGIWGYTATEIQNCLFINNSSLGGGGGNGSEFECPGNGGNGSGGGILITGASEIKNCLNTNNIAKGGSGGLGYVFSNGANGGNGIGSGIYCIAAAQIKNSTISYNSASGGPGGTGNPSPGTNGTGSGGGVYCEDSPEIIDDILWGNADSNGTTKSAQIYGGTPTVSYCCTQGGVFTGTGNISADPCFISGPDGDYYLSQIDAGQAVTSPCANVGSDTAINLGMNLKTTRTDGFCDTGIVDMGYHYPVQIGSPDLDGDAFVDFFDYSIFADNWQQEADPCDPNDGDIVKDNWIDIYDLTIICDKWLTCLVTEATNPEPLNNAIDVNVDAILHWSLGDNALTHDVFFGTDFNEVYNADIYDSNIYMGNQGVNYWDTNNYDSNGLDYNTTYYWRIDEIGPVCDAKGDVWRFTTLTLPPGQASNPVPENTAIDVSVTTDLSWTAGSGTVTHDIHFGTTNPPPFIQNQVSTTYDTGIMDTNTIYYWRIDEKNGGGTTTGNLWSFKTVVQLPSQAGNPIPADTANDVGIAQDLSWSAGSGATSHDVYFGTTNPPPFIVNQTGTTYDPGLMDVNTIYYWQIDEKNTSGTTTGILWNFTTGSESDVNDANLIAWWKFDEGTGTKAYDSKGDNDGNLINGPVWTSGQINGGLSFDGVDDYVNVADDTSLRFTKDSNFTICAWVNPNSISHDGGEVLCKMQANSQKGLFTYELFWQQSLQRFVFEFCNSGYYYEVVSTPDSSAPAGSWYHVTCVYQKKDIDVYLNGVFQDNGYFNSNPTGAANHFMSIGVRSYDTSFEGYFGGTLDDISIYNRALTADEVDLLYKQGLIKRAYNPNPVDEEMDVEPNVVLSWSPVVCALSHDVYFGTDFDDVIDADIYDPNIFMGNQDVNYWDINNYDSNGLDYSTTYYWRIDEVNGPSVWKGEVWSFLTTNPPPPVALLGSWLSGDSHIKETGTNRALVFIAHAEDDGSPDINLNSVSYGGQPMTKVIDTVVGTTWRAYVAAFILDESGVNAASGDTFVCSWNHTPDYYLYASAFLQNVNQTTLIGATDSNSITSGNTITAPAMGTIAGDMVVDAATCGNSGSYTFNNSFTEGTDDTMGSTATGAAGYKSATGAYETPSVTHNNANRQVIIGFVVHREQ